MGFLQIVTGLKKSAMIIINCDSTFVSWKTFVSPWLMQIKVLNKVWYGMVTLFIHSISFRYIYIQV